jgi:hypothetical protein
VAHRRRLRALWRSAGWPSHDLLEAELLVAGLLTRETDPQGRDTLRLTEAGLQLMTQDAQGHRARGAHEGLVARVALEMHRAGRIVWQGLSLRAPVAAEVPELPLPAVPSVSTPTPRRCPGRRRRRCAGSRPCPMSIPSATPRARTGWSRWRTRSRCRGPTCCPT